MTISDIRNSESRLEVKAAAALNLLQPIHRQAFELTLDGILGRGKYEEKKQAAYDWMDKNYEIVAAAVFTAMCLSDDVYRGMCDLDCMLAKLEKEVAV